MKVRVGYCHCGCEGRTLPVAYNCWGRGMVKGVPNQFIHGHNTRKDESLAGVGHKKGRWIMVLMKGHSRSDSHGFVKKHILIAEKILGHPLPEGAEVHHADGNGSNNSNDNLVICENGSYHQLLEWRTRALKESGHANWRRCCYCHNYDDPSRMRASVNGTHIYHPACQKNYNTMYHSLRG